MALITLRDLTLSFGNPPLLDKVQLVIEKGERIGLLGRNGMGKSTLMKLLNGDILPDNGEIHYQKNIKVARLNQEVPLDIAGSIFDVVASGLGQVGELLIHYHQLCHELSAQSNETILANMERVQGLIDAAQGWQLNQQVESVLSLLKLPIDHEFNQLSGGLKRRVLLAKAMVQQPDVLLLDEPTNHLDIESIQWLEALLVKFSGTLIFVTHDRLFLQNLATRIIELDRGHLSSWDCNYSNYLIRKAAMLEAESTANALFDKRLAQEEIWIRQGIKARRTRNEGRVRALKKMREEHKQRRNRVGQVQMKLTTADRSGKLVVEAENVNYAYANKTIIKNFSTIIMRGDKIGIIGPNGAGKTTLLRILLGDLKPQTGTIDLGTNLNITYFDQLRAGLDENATIIDNVAQGTDTITINGKSQHVISYLQDFLFTPQRARSPISVLSGGERNRLLLAKLFTKATNVLVLDEPTNDLDIETLDLLEELLIQYTGTLLLVSHDRAFLNNVVTSTLVLEGDGKVGEYVGGYDDWMKYQLTSKKVSAEQKPITPAVKSNNKVNKSSYTDKKELAEITKYITQLEIEKDNVCAYLADPKTYQIISSDKITQENLKLATIEANLKIAYQRWEELEQ